jgi:sulfopyruvate decarboxylase TPP-binding subunit
MEVMQVVDIGNFMNVLEKFYMCIEKPILITN